MGLFNTGEFVLASGRESDFLVDCRFLTESDWNALAAYAVKYHLPPFGQVQGVPRGGLPFADALRRYSRACPCTYDHPAHDWCEGKPLPNLLVDDVWTTGGSVREFIASPDCLKPFMFRRGACVVLFARGPTPPWVIPLFRATPSAIE